MQQIETSPNSHSSKNKSNSSGIVKRTSDAFCTKITEILSSQSNSCYINENSQMVKILTEKKLAIVQEIINILRRFGILQNESQESRIKTSFMSPDFYNTDRKVLAQILGIENVPSEVFLSLESDKSFQKVIHELWEISKKSLLLTIDIDNLHLHEKNGIMNESDRSFELGKIRQSILNIKNDPNINFKHGVFFNVAISENVPFVLKLEKALDYKGKSEYQRKSIFHYFDVHQVFGQEMVPNQTVFNDSRHEKYYVLQQKINLDEMYPIRADRIDRIISGKMYPEIKKCILSNPENGKKIEEFLRLNQELLQKNHLFLDLAGDNIFFDVKEGKLSIYIVDTGCFEESALGLSPEFDAGVQKTKKCIASLQNLITLEPEKD